VAFLDAVRVERASLVGHSGSCFVARRVAELKPERVARLVLIGSPGSLGNNRAVLEFQTAVRALEDPVPAQFAREVQRGAAHVRLPEPFFERMVAESLKLPARVWKSALDGLLAFDDTADLGRISAPTLLLWGQSDRLLSQEEQDHLAAAIPGAARTGSAHNRLLRIWTPSCERHSGSPKRRTPSPTLCCCTRDPVCSAAELRQRFRI
jgi:pimeloyl-ACP methyl ester carboxylesterase